MDKGNLKQLLNKYAGGRCTEEEKAWVETWYNRRKPGDIKGLPESVLEKDLEEIYQALPDSSRNAGFTWRRAAAVLALLIASAGLYFYSNSRQEETPLLAEAPAADAVRDIAPGGNKAVLILEDGTTISLDEIESGNIAEQNGISITKAGDGLVTYSTTAVNKGNQEAPALNTIKTPRGGQYQLILPDETKVWLNAASSLTYPAAFTGNERRVSLSGEAYFEVTSDKTRPFSVVTGDQIVEVLGTHFNISNYADEPFVKTTLVEGSVKVHETRSGSSMILEPGEQSKLSDHAFSVANVNIGHEIAWKNGLFQFQGSDIESVMRQLARWYDVDVEFQGEIPDIQLWGEVYRNVNASQALEILGYFNVRYKITETDSRKKIVIY